MKNLCYIKMVVISEFVHGKALVTHSTSPQTATVN